MATTPTFENPYPAGSDAAAHYSALLGRCIDGTYRRFSEIVAQANYCSHPIRLRGAITTSDSAGATTTTYSTVNEPDGVLLKACGNRRATACPSCAALYRSDARHLIRAGLAGGKGLPESVSTHPMVFATFTAPSFGAVHRAGKDGQSLPCHPAKPAEVCKHGVATACFSRHDENDPAVGEPICAKCYDYEGTVLFNAMANKLWRYTTTYLRRRLARVVGMKRCDFDDGYRVSFAKVIEYQKRGVVHIHSIIRVDGIGEDGEAVCPEGVNAAHLMAATIAASRQVGIYYPVKSKNRPLKARWGTQIDVSPLDGSTPEAVAKIAAYVAKYATKSLDGSGLLDNRLKPCDARIAKLPDHSRRLVESALALADNDQCRNLNLALWANAYGYRGHWLTKSRGYSTTFRALHEERIAWATRHPARAFLSDEEPPDDSPICDDEPPESYSPDSDAPSPVAEPTASVDTATSCTTTRSFTFCGRGYKSRGDWLFARSQGENYVESRRLAYEAMMEERAYLAEFGP